MASAIYGLSRKLVHGFFRIVFGKKEMLQSATPPCIVYLWSKYKRLMSHQDENYEEIYGFVDYKDKTVLDIGADYGSTALFFLEKGAKKVYAVERNKWMIKEMNNTAKKIDNLFPVELDVSCSGCFTGLLALNPDIVKVDCEGCEEYLLEVKPKILSSIKEYIIETHTQELYNNFVKKFERMGFVISNVRLMHASEVRNNIILFYAKKEGNG